MPSHWKETANFSDFLVAYFHNYTERIRPRVRCISVPTFLTRGVRPFDRHKTTFEAHDRWVRFVNYENLLIRAQISAWSSSRQFDDDLHVTDEEDELFTDSVQRRKTSIYVQSTAEIGFDLSREAVLRWLKCWRLTVMFMPEPVDGLCLQRRRKFYSLTGHRRTPRKYQYRNWHSYKIANLWEEPYI